MNCFKVQDVAYPEIFFSTIKTYGFSSSAFMVLLSVMKYGDMYPRSNFIPSTTSSSFSRVLPSYNHFNTCQCLAVAHLWVYRQVLREWIAMLHTATVITPSLPTFSMAFEIRSPISFSPFAEMVPTYAHSPNTAHKDPA